MNYGGSNIEGTASQPSKPFSNRDFDFFYEGLSDGRLLVQQCSSCKALRNPPGPNCHACRSFEWKPLELAGRGSVYSYMVHYHPPLPGYATPHPVILAEMEEGIRVMGAADGIPPDQIEIGMRVEVEFVSRGDWTGFRFCLPQQ